MEQLHVNHIVLCLNVSLHFYFLLVSRLGDLRAENDANCTYEGENNVLIQQASNWLLNQWSNMINGKPVNSPFRTADFIQDANNILPLKFSCATSHETLEPESMEAIL